MEWTDYAKLHDLALEFQMRNLADRQDKSPKLISKPGEIVNDLSKIAGDDNNLYNALKYLEDKGFIEAKNSQDTTCDNFLKLRVVSGGIDVIEAILRGAEEKKEFYAVFNIKLSEKLDLEGLLKAQLGSLFKTAFA